MNILNCLICKKLLIKAKYNDQMICLNHSHSTVYYNYYGDNLTNVVMNVNFHNNEFHICWFAQNSELSIQSTTILADDKYIYLYEINNFDNDFEFILKDYLDEIMFS